MARANEPTDVFQYIDMRGPDECWPWTGTWGGREDDRRPYFMCNGRRTMAYRWVYELVHGEQINAQRMILHSCDHGGYPTGCCNPAHLRLGSPQENVDDRTDRQRYGLPHKVIQAIRKLRSEGKTQAEVASLYGISRETVSAIDTGRTYSQVIGVADKP